MRGSEGGQADGRRRDSRARKSPARRAQPGTYTSSRLHCSMQPGRTSAQPSTLASCLPSTAVAHSHDGCFRKENHLNFILFLGEPAAAGAAGALGHAGRQGAGNWAQRDVKGGPAGLAVETFSLTVQGLGGWWEHLQAARQRVSWHSM